MITKQQYQTALNRVKYYKEIESPTDGELREIEYWDDFITRYGKQKEQRENLRRSAERRKRASLQSRFKYTAK